MSLTVGRAWRVVRDRLRDAGVEAPAREARLLAELAFGLEGAALALAETEVAAPEAVARLTAFGDRRARGEPLARIAGRREFYGLSFALGAATLVPRPETELLVDVGLAHVAGRPGGRLLDLGTGSGCIAIAMLSSHMGLNALATDLSGDALDVARDNAGAHHVLGRIEFMQGSWFAAVGQDALFDVIVSNPPYVETGVIGQLERDVRDHDPQLALDGGADGLGAYRIIIAEAPKHLSAGGLLAVEVGLGQAAEVQALMGEAGLSLVTAYRDLADIDRVVAGVLLTTA